MPVKEECIFGMSLFQICLYFANRYKITVSTRQQAWMPKRGRMAYRHWLAVLRWLLLPLFGSCELLAEVVIRGQA